MSLAPGSSASLLGPRQQLLLAEVRRAGALSRQELHQRTGMRPNTVGDETARLIRLGLLRESAQRVRGRGRPSVPLTLDPERRHVLGLALRPGLVEVARLGPTGVPQPSERHLVRRPDELIRTAAACLKQKINPATLAVGVSAPGFVDPIRRTILFSALWPDHQGIDARSLVRAAGRCPVYLANDMHALASHWRLTRAVPDHEDALLVHLDDGQLGAVLLVEGRPTQGCVNAANELGHTRLPIATPRCYCGQVGCLERIVSTAFLRQKTRSDSPDLLTLAAQANEERPPATWRVMMDSLALSLANAVNFTRVNRLALTGRLGETPAFARQLLPAVRRLLLKELADRVTLEVWPLGQLTAAQTAGWLALGRLFGTV